MTEAEAKTKWCPFSRSAAPLGNKSMGATVNRFHDADGCGEGAVQPYAKCFGSQCMAWRFEKKLPAGAAACVQRVQSEHGFCGLAGKP